MLLWKRFLRFTVSPVQRVKPEATSCVASHDKCVCAWSAQRLTGREPCSLSLMHVLKVESEMASINSIRTGGSSEGLSLHIWPKRQGGGEDGHVRGRARGPYVQRQRKQGRVHVRRQQVRKGIPAALSYPTVSPTSSSLMENNFKHLKAV